MLAIRKKDAAPVAPPPQADLFHGLLQGLYDAVLICDRECRVLEANARAEKLLRANAAALKGRSLSNLILNFDPAMMVRIERRLQRGRFTVLEAFCARDDSTTFPAEVAISRINLTSAGEFVFSIRNIEWRKKTEEAIRREAEAQMARARAEDDFSGYLNIISIADVLQLIEASKKSGTLAVTNADGVETGSVDVLEGAIVAARCGDRSGDAAVYEIMKQGGAAFYFRQGRPERKDGQITKSTMGLLLEGSRLMDEGQAPG